MLRIEDPSFPSIIIRREKEKEKERESVSFQFAINDPQITKPNLTEREIYYYIPRFVQKTRNFL